MSSTYEKILPLISHRLGHLVDNHIISSTALAHSRQFTRHEFAIRHTRFVRTGQVIEEDHFKFKTLFGEPIRQEFSFPDTQGIANLVERTLPDLKKEYPTLLGFLFFGSRANPHHTPRNIAEFTSDVDLVSVWIDRNSELIPRAIIQALEEDLKNALTLLRPDFARVPIKIVGHERGDHFITILGYGSRLGKVPYWANDPEGVRYLGSGFKYGKRRNSIDSQGLTRYIRENIGSPEFELLRRKEIVYKYGHLSP